MLQRDLEFLSLISVKPRLTYGDLRECIAIYSRNTSIFNRFSRFYTKDYLPQSIYELKQIMLHTQNRSAMDTLDSVTLENIKSCIAQRGLRNSRSSRKIDSCSSLIFHSLQNNEQILVDADSNQVLKKEDRDNFIKDVMTKARGLRVNATVWGKLRGLQALASGTWVIQPDKDNIYSFDAFLITSGYKTPVQVDRLIEDIFGIYYTGYQLALRLGKFQDYFENISGHGCLAATTRSVTDWILKWERVAQNKENRTMDDFMARIQSAIPHDKTQASSDELLTWYVENFSGTNIGGKLLQKNDFRQYMIEKLGHEEEDFATTANVATSQPF